MIFSKNNLHFKSKENWSPFHTSFSAFAAQAKQLQLKIFNLYQRLI
jgi:hypothetical protein